MRPTVAAGVHPQRLRLGPLRRRRLLRRPPRRPDRPRPVRPGAATAATSTSTCAPVPSCGPRRSSRRSPSPSGSSCRSRPRARSPPATPRSIFPFVALLVAGGVTRFAGPWVRFGALLVLCAFLGVGALWNIADTRTQAGEVGDGHRRQRPARRPRRLLPRPARPGRQPCRHRRRASRSPTRPSPTRSSSTGSTTRSATTPTDPAGFAARALERVARRPGDLRGLERRVQDLRGRLRGARRRHRRRPPRPGARRGQTAGSSSTASVTWFPATS